MVQGRVVKRAQYLNPLSTDVQGHKRYKPLRQQLSDDLPNASEASDDDMIPQLCSLLLCWLEGLQATSSSAECLPWQCIILENLHGSIPDLGFHDEDVTAAQTS